MSDEDVRKRRVVIINRTLSRKHGPVCTHVCEVPDDLEEPVDAFAQDALDFIREAFVEKFVELELAIWTYDVMTLDRSYLEYKV